MIGIPVETSYALSEVTTTLKYRNEQESLRLLWCLKDLTWSDDGRRCCWVVPGQALQGRLS